MGTTSDKLTYLNETKTKIKDNLNFGGANITNETFREYADKIKDLYVYFMNNGLDVVWNNWEKVIGSGTSITLNQTMEAPIKIDLKGNTEQNGTPTPSSPIEVETTTGREEVQICGKNLINAIETNKYTASSGAIQSGNTSYLGIDDYVSCKPDTTYSITFEHDSSSALLYVSYKDNQGNFISRTNYSTNRTFTTPNNASTLFFYLYKADTFTTIGGYVQLEYGSTPSSYETYQEQSYELNLGKNLFNINNIETTTGIIYNNGFTLIKTTDRVVRFILPQILPAGTYTISYDTINYVHTLTNSFFVTLQYSSDYTNVVSNIVLNNNNNATFTAPSQFDRLYFFISNSENDTATITIDNVQLEKGNQPSTYSPYKTPIELCKIGDYQDYLYKENNNWYIHKEIGRVVLNGSENYATGSLSGYYRFQTTLSVPNKTLDNEAILLSNNFKGISFNNRNAQTNETCFMSNGNLSFNTNVANSENSFKTWLSTHNTDVYYILNTPTTTKITDYELIYQLNELEKAKSYDNTTNILQSNDNLPFILDVRALKK